MSNFVNAAACGDLADIKAMLANKTLESSVINGRDKDGRTALHYACLNDDINLLPLLLSDSRVDLGATTPNKDGIFHLAALYSSLQALNLLVSNVDALKYINAQNKFNESPLILAAATGNKKSWKTCEILLKNGASFLVTDQWNRGAIDAAFFNGHNWLSDLLKEFAKSNLTANELEKVKEISSKVQKDQMKVVELSQSLVKERTKMANMFGGELGLNLKKNLKKTTTVEKTMFSTSEGKVVSKGKKGVTTLVSGKVLSKMIDFPGDKQEIEKILTDSDVNVAGKDSFGLTALHKFSSWNKPELIELILPKLSKDQVNETDLEGKTALHWACEMASVSTVTFLIEKCGIDKELKDKKGRTALEIVNSGSGDVIERLKKALMATSI